MPSIAARVGLFAILLSACRTEEHYRVRDADLPPLGPVSTRCWVPAVRAGEPGKPVLVDARSIDSRAAPEEGDTLVRSRAVDVASSVGVPLTVFGTFLSVIGGSLVIGAVATRADYDRTCLNECLGNAIETAFGAMLLVFGASHLIPGTALTARGARHRPQERPVAEARSFPPCVTAGERQGGEGR